MPVTEEELARRRASKVSLKALYQGCCSYDYSQGDELNKISAYKKSKGVCFAMSIDWVRRLLFNENNPDVKQKRNFNDPKYADKEKKRIALTKKHGKLQEVYQNSTEKRPTVATHIHAMAAKQVVSSGMDHLVVTRGTRLPSYQLDESAYNPNDPNTMGSSNVHGKLKGKVAEIIAGAGGKLNANCPGVGILIEMSGEGSGHAIACHVDPSHIKVFDPNLGEYSFPATLPAYATAFVAAVWFDLYHRHLKLNTVELFYMLYGDPDAD